MSRKWIGLGVALAMTVLGAPPSGAVTLTDASTQPTSVVASAGNASGQAIVSWSAPSDSATVLGYRVTPYLDATAVTGSVVNTSGTGTGPVTVTGLTNGQSYTFKVAAVYPEGQGLASVASAAVVPFTTPDAPTISSATAGNASVTVAWNAPASNGGSAITQYIVSCNPVCTQVTTSSLSVTVTGLTNGTAYTFTVEAENARGKSAPSAASSSATPFSTPGSPTIGAVTTDSGTATVNWSAPASDGGSAITGYSVKTYQLPDTATVVKTTTAAAIATSATVTGLKSDGTQYRFTVVATNAGGDGTASALSATATPVAAAAPTPSITSQPTAVTVAAGGTATFSVSDTATGTPTLTRQWQSRTIDVATWSNLVGETGTSLAVVTDSTTVDKYYRVVVTNTVGVESSSTTSNSARLTVNNPLISSQPANVKVGKNGTATLSVAVTATTGASISYQWKAGGSNTGTNAATLSANTASLGTTSYTVVVTSALNGTTANVTSNAATVTVVDPPTITGQPQNDTKTVGATETFSVTATANGSGGSLAYQWRKDGVNIGGATSSTYVIQSLALADAGTYSVVVTDTTLLNSGSTTSANAVLTVDSGAPSISTQPSSTTVALGGTATLTVVASAPGQGQTQTFQWKRGGVSLSDAGTVSGSSSATLQITPVADGDYASYTVTVTNTAGSAVASVSSNTVFINRKPTFTTQPSGKTVSAGSPVVLTAKASVPTGATATLQWRKGGVNVNGATTETLTIANAVSGDAGSYALYVTSTLTSGGTSYAVSETSSAATVTVRALPSITTQPIAAVTRVAGDSLTISVVAAVDTGSAGTLTYQWRKNGVDLSGQTSASLTLNPLASSDSATYTVVVTDDSYVAGTGSVTSTGAVVTVLTNPNKPVITTQPTTQTLVSGGTLNLSVVTALTTDGGVLSYQWKLGGSAIGGATNSSYSTTLDASNFGAYTVVVTNTAGGKTDSVTSSVAFVNAAPVITVQPQSPAKTLGAGATETLTVTATVPNNATASYQWKKNGSNIASATGSSLVLSGVSASDSATYTVVITSTIVSGSESNTVSTTSSGAVVSVGALPSISVQPVGKTLLKGATLTLSVTASAAGAGTLTYQWQQGTNLLSNGGRVSGATSSTLTITNLDTATDSTDYVVIVTDSSYLAGTGDTKSAVVAVNVTTTPLTPETSTVTPSSGSAYDAGTIAFSVAVTGLTAGKFSDGGSVAYQWQHFETSTWVDLPSATNASYTVTMSQAAAGDYRVKVTNAGTGSTTETSTAYSNTVTATRQVQAPALSKTAQTITFAQPAGGKAGTVMALTASASSGLAITFSSETPLTCTVSGSSAQLLKAGACSITAAQPGNDLYSAATSVTRTVTVEKKDQTLSFSAPADGKVGGSVTLTATASSGLPVAYSGGAAGVCTVSGSTVTLTGTGTCSVTAAQVGDDNFAAAVSVTRTFAVGKKDQTITFATPGTANVGGSIALGGSATSGLAVTYASSSGSVCSVSGSTVSVLAAGDCTVTASQAGDATWATAAPVSRTWWVGKKDQTVSISTPSDITTVSSRTSVSASASSGLPVTISGGTDGVCDVSGTTVTILGAGTCSITASQGGDSMWNPATASADFEIARASEKAPAVPGLTPASPTSVVAVDKTPATVPVGTVTKSAGAATTATVSTVVDKPVSVQLTALPAKATAAATLKTPDGKTITLPSVKVTSTGKLVLPTVAMAKAGTYTFTVKVGGKTRTVKVVVNKKP